MTYIGISPDVVAAQYPFLYHMAALGSWSGIKAQGLLSTSALLDLYGIQGSERIALERSHRPRSVILEHAAYASATIRDQKPMSDRGLQRALQDGLTPEQWYVMLNDKVFFWVTRGRLERLLGAGEYRHTQHDVLVLRTASVLAEYSDRVLLAGMNTGATNPFPHPRGRDTFLPLSTYPFEARRKARKEPIVELAVQGGVPNAAKHAIEVFTAQADQEWKSIWKS